jgi:hypothetical protein
MSATIILLLQGMEKSLRELEAVGLGAERYVHPFQPTYDPCALSRKKCYYINANQTSRNKNLHSSQVSWRDLGNLAFGAVIILSAGFSRGSPRLLFTRWLSVRSYWHYEHRNTCRKTGTLMKYPISLRMCYR